MEGEVVIWRGGDGKGKFEAEEGVFVGFDAWGEFSEEGFIVFGYLTEAEATGLADEGHDIAAFGYGDADHGRGEADLLDPTNEGAGAAVFVLGGENEKALGNFGQSGFDHRREFIFHTRTPEECRVIGTMREV